MNSKPIYYLSILLISIVIFLYISNENKPQNASENQSKPTSTHQISAEAVPLLINKTSNKFDPEELEGAYLNHTYVRETPALSDKILRLNYNDHKQLEAYYIYYESLGREDNGEEWGVQRYGGTTTLTPISDTVFIIDQTIEPFTDDLLYIIKTENQIGLSFDGKTIDFYKNQHIIPSLSDNVLIKHFYGEDYINYPNDIEGHTIKIERIEHFQELGVEYALVFFEEYFSTLYSLRGGTNSSYLSIAKLRKESDGMHEVYFCSHCPCGHYTTGPVGAADRNDVISYPTLHKIGHKHFLLQKYTEDDTKNVDKTVLQVYDTDEFKKVLSVPLEIYTTNYYNEKTYSLKNTFSFTEDDCAIIIQPDSVLEAKNNFRLQQDIYLFEEDNNMFVKSNLDS